MCEDRLVAALEHVADSAERLAEQAGATAAEMATGVGRAIAPGDVVLRLDSKAIADAVTAHTVRRAARGPSQLVGGSLLTPTGRSTPQLEEDAARVAARALEVYDRITPVNRRIVPFPRDSDFLGQVLAIMLREDSIRVGPSLPKAEQP